MSYATSWLTPKTCAWRPLTGAALQASIWKQCCVAVRNEGVQIGPPALILKMKEMVRGLGSQAVSQLS